MFLALYSVLTVCGTYMCQYHTVLITLMSSSSLVLDIFYGKSHNVVLHNHYNNYLQSSIPSEGQDYFDMYHRKPIGKFIYYTKSYPWTWTLWIFFVIFLIHFYNLPHEGLVYLLYILFFKKPIVLSAVIEVSFYYSFTLVITSTKNETDAYVLTHISNPAEFLLILLIHLQVLLNFLCIAISLTLSTGRWFKNMPENSQLLSSRGQVKLCTTTAHSPQYRLTNSPLTNRTW